MIKKSSFTTFLIPFVSTFDDGKTKDILHTVCALTKTCSVLNNLDKFAHLRTHERNRRERRQYVVGFSLHPPISQTGLLLTFTTDFPGSFLEKLINKLWMKTCTITLKGKAFLGTVIALFPYLGFGNPMLCQLDYRKVAPPDRLFNLVESHSQRRSHGSCRSSSSSCHASRCTGSSSCGGCC